MKDTKKYIILPCLWLLMSLTALSQMPDINKLSNSQLKKYAQSAERSRDYFTAIRLYEKFLVKKKDNHVVSYALANLYRKTRDYEKARELFTHIWNKYPKKYPKSLYYLAEMEQVMGNYDQAMKLYDEFKKIYRGEKDYREYNKLVRYAIDGCEIAKELINKPLKVSIENMNSTINGAHVELSPFPVNDSLFIYSSLRMDSIMYFNEETPMNEIPVRKFYKARKRGLDWTGGYKMEGPFNKNGVETGNGAFSRDGKRFYFTRCFKNWQNKIICELYVSHKKNKQWQEPVKLPEPVNDVNYTTTQPAIGNTARRNREVIYFVSDRPGGKGKLDLWYTVWRDDRDEYSTPRNLGSRINTPGNEMTPYYNYTSRTMTYSSDGLPGLGGLDIFKITGERRRWTRPENIGYPLNSGYDDLYFTVSKNQEEGFFVSNRPQGESLLNETCCDNIFYYHWDEFIRLYVTGKIYPLEKDRFGRKKDFSHFDFMNPPDTIEPMEDAVIAMYMQNVENDELMFIERDTTGAEGKYVFRLLPEKNYEFKMEGFQYFEDKVYLSTEMINFSDTLEMPPIWVNVLTDQPIVLENIYYEFNESELSETAKNVLDTTLLVLLEEAPEFIVEIGSHTDNIGEDKYNLELSQERAENVVEYLISKGVSEERLVARGYGSQKPVAPNTNPDGSDNPEGRRKNRRTEFRIIGTIYEAEDEEFED